MELPLLSQVFQKLSRSEEVIQDYWQNHNVKKVHTTLRLLIQDRWEHLTRKSAYNIETLDSRLAGAFDAMLVSFFGINVTNF